MPEQPDPKIKELEDRLDALVRTQIDFQTEITAIRRELVRLNASRIMAPPLAREDKEALYARLERTAPPPPVQQTTSTPPVVAPGEQPKPPVVPPQRPIETPPPTSTSYTPPQRPVETTPPAYTPDAQMPRPKPPVREPAYELPKRTPYVADPVLSSATTSGDAFSRFVSQYTDKARENLEEFVGKNLISLIGIVVLILGVGIGAKYAIDNNLISPLTRIIVGYIFGFGLVGLAIKLKRNYHNFSAVLISGGMAIMYFVTYFAYSAYGLIGQLPTFGLMIMFTVCTVAAALIYSRQVIAHIGLVGAYAVPFLLSTDSGNYLALFTYMTVVNAGILVISLKKDWKPIFYTSSVFTWAIFCGWYATKYSAEHFNLALIFLGGFFLIFYAAKVAQAYFLADDADRTENTVGSVLTTAVFYAMCFAITVGTSHESSRYWILFTYLAAASALVVATSLRFHREPFTYYASWLGTWTIFCGWYATKYSEEYFNLALIFLAVFFVTFYAVNLVQARLLSDDADPTENTITSVLTTAVFYVMAFAITVGPSHEPFRYWILFTYLAIASALVVATSLRFHRNPLTLYTSWLATWAIFCGWFGTHYSHDEYFYLALIFLAVFFALFYGTALVQRKLLAAEADTTPNLATALLTGLVFYGFCFGILFNLSSASTFYWTFLTYVGVAAAVMLATSFKFYGRAFMYLVVPLTWAMYGSWFSMRYDAEQHFQLAVIFAALYFALFYFSILFHRLVENNFTLVEHTSLILGNAFTFYGFGYALLDRHADLNPYLGLYTAASAVLHLVVLLAVRALAPKAVDVVQVLTILVLTLASLAVPVQFDGNVVTMVWALEAAVLFGYGRMRGVRLFESYSYPVMILAVASLFLDWSVSYSDRVQGLAAPLTPIANPDFITALVFVVAFGFIYITNRNQRYEPAIKTELVRPFGIMLGVVGTFVLYNMFRIEIGNYFFALTVNNVRELGLVSPTRPTGDAQTFNIAWQINYTLFFLVCAAALNLKKLRSSTLTMANSILGVLALAVFSTVSMFLFYLLRAAFMMGSFEPDVVSHWMYIGIRPISYSIAAALLYMLYEYCRDPLLEDRVETRVLRYAYDALAYTFVFIVASCELLNLMEQLRLADGTKLGLSILWGVYALILIIIGIAKDKKHLRIAAMVLLGVTLAKLFFYDIADLDTIPKTILFVTLGITLLVVSFLYNKYKGVILKTGVTQED